MGATFCNLYCSDEQSNTLKSMLSAEDRVLYGFNGWCMALAEDRDPNRMMKIARKLTGDVLIFFYYDDDFFELTLYQNGKKSASANSGGIGHKLSVLVTLLPSDPKALRKLRALKDCASIYEGTSLLEETFGLPFYALYEQESVSAVPISESTWNTVKARIDAFRKRPNRFQIQTLTPDEWPYSTKIRMRLVTHFRELGLSFKVTWLFSDISRRLFSQCGRPYRILLPMYIEHDGRKNHSGYNTVIMADFDQHEAITYSFSFTVSQPLLVNGDKAIICVNDKQNGLLCLDEHGNEKWQFAPNLVRPQLNHIRTDREEIVVYCTDYGSKTATYRIWRISPENGQIINERILTGDNRATGLNWLADMGCFMYYALNKNDVVLLNWDFSEMRRFQLGDNVIRFDTGFRSGHHAYTSLSRNDGTRDLISLDLLSGEISQIHTEVPVFIVDRISSGIFMGYSGAKMDTLNLLNQEGKVISRHHFSDARMGVWEENGNIYGATTQRSRFPGLWEDSQIDSLSVFKLVNSLDSSQ